MTVKPRDKEGNALKMYEWYKGFEVYKGPRDVCENYCDNQELCLSQRCDWNGEASYQYKCFSKSYNYGAFQSSDVGIAPIGDRIVYVSPKPQNGLHTDVVFRYTGVKNE
jgi:hypothetical protein